MGNNHALLSAALQKFYGALKALDDFGKNGSFFDDVAKLDCFFSEMRNITFVIQKWLDQQESKEKYEAARDEFLSGDTMKWFVKTRNKTTKEEPFPLKKELVIDIYLPNGVFSLKNKGFIIDVDQSFDEALRIIKEVFISKLQFKELYFSATIRFREAETHVDLYPKIKTGVIQMHQFMGRIQETFPCDCEECSSLQNLISELYNRVQCKEIEFTKDYGFEEDLIEGDRAGMYLSVNGSEMVQISEIRSQMDDPIFGETNGCVYEIFRKFVVMHIFLFREQQNSIMPVFMIVYSDNTQKVIPFVATTKSTFYRMVKEICDTVDFDEVIAVLYCGEFYLYDKKRQLHKIVDKPYSERVKMSHKDMLGFSMLLKGGEEQSVYFEEHKLNDIQYIRKNLASIKPHQTGESWMFDWLAPIKQKLR